MAISAADQKRLKVIWNSHVLQPLFISEAQSRQLYETFLILIYETFLSLTFDCTGTLPKINGVIIKGTNQVKKSTKRFETHALFRRTSVLEYFMSCSVVGEFD